MAILHGRVQPGSGSFAANRAAFEARITTLRARLAEAAAGGHPEMIARHRRRGKLVVRERIDLICDPGTAPLELSSLAAWGQYGGEVPGAGIVTGIGIVHGLPCMVIANDATVKGGSFCHETVQKHIRAQEIAAGNRLPCLCPVDCGGAYLPEQDRVFPDARHFGNAFFRQTNMSASGLPQISAVLGGCTAGGACIPALSDEVIMVRGNACIHPGGPSIVKVAIHEEVDGETPGGAEMHSRVSGVSDHLAEDEFHALALMRDIVAELGLVRPMTPDAPCAPPLHDPAGILGVVSADRRQPCDMREVLVRLIDAGEWREFKPGRGETMQAELARIEAGVRTRYAEQSDPCYATSRLWDDGLIEPGQTRDVPGLCLAIVASVPETGRHTPVFRM